MTTTIWKIPNVFWTAVAAAIFVAAGCSVALKDDPAQCKVDSDCTKFGGHPYCENNVCVASGLGPSTCYYGAPTNQSQFLNQCSTAVCLNFDDCERLGICDGGLSDAGLITPPLPDAGAPATGGSGDAAAPSYANCVDPENGRPANGVVVITGSSNFPTTLQLVAPYVIDAGFTPIFQTTSSCNGVNAIFSPATSAGLIQDPAVGAASTKYAQFYHADGTPETCLLGDGGLHVDIGESDIFSSTCGAGDPPAGVGEWIGPVQAMVFAVPGNSSQTAITATAAQVVFGKGGDSGRSAPWTDPTKYYVRSASTGTQQMIGHAIGVPASSFWGVSETTALGVANAVLGTKNADVDSVIGILSVDVYDSKRPNLKALAFRAQGQDCSYLPDSTPFTVDKQNVRDGHYPIWGPIHFYSASIGSAAATPQAQAFMTVVAPPRLSQDLVKAMVESSLVPDCAMRVKRTTELGALASYSPQSQCSCYFLSIVDNNPHPECGTCIENDDCKNPSRPACNYGFCEVQ